MDTGHKLLVDQSMARKKVTLAWIPSDSSRRATFKKRRKGLIKKVGELSTLCDVQACAIVYRPYDHQPEVWLPSAEAAAAVLDGFRSLPLHRKKTLDQEALMVQRANKVRDQLKRVSAENRATECAIFVHQCLRGQSDATVDLGVDDLRCVHREIDELIKAVGLQSLELQAAVTAPVMEPVPLQSTNVGWEIALAEEMGQFNPGADQYNPRTVDRLTKTAEMFVCNNNPLIYWTTNEATTTLDWQSSLAEGDAESTAGPGSGRGRGRGGENELPPYFLDDGCNTTISNYSTLEPYYYY